MEVDASAKVVEVLTTKGNVSKSRLVRLSNGQAKRSTSTRPGISARVWMERNRDRSVRFVFSVLLDKDDLL